MDFRPTLPPHGRLARLGLVLDTRNAWGRLAEIARMCDDAGIDALWVRDHLASADGEPRLEAWTALAMAGRETRRPRVGAVLTMAFRPPAVLAAMAGTLDAAIGGRLELGLSAGRVEREHVAFGLPFPDPETGVHQIEHYARVLHDLLAGKEVDLGASAEAGTAELAVTSPQPGGPPLSIEAITPAQMEVAARVADDVLLPSAAVRDLGALAARVREACERAGREPASLGVALEIPVSVGRTVAESLARAEAEPLFEVTGQPQEVGIFGTLEQCQERVIELAHAGVTDLRCVVPNAPDIHDVIAQLTAITIGTVDVLTPGTPKSRAPDPPDTWGGRARRR